MRRILRIITSAGCKPRLPKFSYARQRTLINRFLRAEIANVEKATALVFRSAAEEHKRFAVREIKRKFKAGPNTNRGFFKAVKIHNLPAKGTLGPASYVRLGVPFMRVFTEGDTIRPRGKYLIILLPEGAKLGYQRITRGNPWDRVWRRMQKDAAIIQKSDGNVIAVRRRGQLIPIYKFQRQVIVKKRLSFYEIGQEVARDVVPDIVKTIDRLND
jgi:hypothetical protein